MYKNNIHTHVHTPIHTHTHKQTHTQTDTHIRMYIYIHRRLYRYIISTSLLPPQNAYAPNMHTVQDKVAIFSGARTAASVVMRRMMPPVSRKAKWTTPRSRTIQT